MTLIKVLLALYLALVSGYSILAIFRKRRIFSSISGAALAFGLGIGAVSVIQVMFLSLSIKITPLTMIAAFFVVSLSTLPITLKERKLPGEKERSRKPGILPLIIALLLAVQLVWIIIKTFNYPIIDDDGVWQWGLKAKIIYYSNERGESLKEIAPKMSLTSNGNHPLLIPLAEHYVNVFAGEWNDLYFKAIFPLFYLALLGIFYGYLRRFTGVNYASVCAFLLASLPFMAKLATWGVPDIALAYYHFAGFVLILLWMKDRDTGLLVLSAIFSALSVWTKNEGYPSAVINAAVVILFLFTGGRDVGAVKMKKTAVVFLYTAAVMAAILLVWCYQKSTGVSDLIVNGRTFILERVNENTGRIPYIFNQFQKQMFGAVNKWDLVGYLFVFSIFYQLIKRQKGPEGYILFVIIFKIAVYAGVYYISPLDVKDHIDTSLYRIYLHIVPFILLYSALALKDIAAGLTDIPHPR
ncbi:MAG: hypothetical protein HQL30_00910 [Candidatus Omnitrophica bacterium]|nr:hypothetical protein [Candidatus Omnitrophota bacterium]